MGMCEGCEIVCGWNNPVVMCPPLRAKLEEALKMLEYLINSMSGICDGRIYTVRGILKEVLGDANV